MISFVQARNLLAALALIQVGCEGGDGDGGNTADAGGSSEGIDAGEPTNGFTVAGGITGTPIPPSSDITVGWMVSSGSPDYIYITGAGQSVADTFSVTVPESLTSEAVNSYGVGVGFVVLIDEGGEISTGVLAEEDDSLILGISQNHAIIWIDEASSGPGWSEAFPVGYSCGVCVPADKGESFDSFVPVSCDEVLISTPFEGVCNWT